MAEETRFLPALADAIALWFPELGGRALAVSEVTINKENVPTLPLAMVAFARGTGNQGAASATPIFGIEDTFVVEFWLQPARYKKATGAETPFWSYYDYEAIRETLFTNIFRWQAPGGQRIAYRQLDLEADALAVTLTFTFIATSRWCAAPAPPDQTVESVGFKLCTPPGVCVPECFDQPEPDPCP